MTPEALAVVGGIAALALLAVGALALQVHGLTGRMEKFERAQEVERKHRERLTDKVERP